jgi:hypothetical protein
MNAKAAGAVAVMLAVLMAGVGIGARMEASKAPSVADSPTLNHPPRADTPASSVPNAPKKSTPVRSALFRADCARLEREYAVRVPRGSRFECAVVRADEGFDKAYEDFKRHREGFDKVYEDFKRRREGGQR